MIHIQLDDAPRTELQSLRRTAVAAVVRDRLEMLFLSDAGWSPPRIADHLGYDPQTVRKVLHGWKRKGQAILFPATPGPEPDTGRRDTILGHLTDRLRQDRTWTSAQLAEALREHGVTLGDRQVRRYLRQLQAGYRRTASTLEHKQDPAKVERAEGVLGNLEKKRRRAG
jgi:transposase